MNCNFYVYFHRKKSNNEIFYVGKGSGGRAWWFYGRSTYWNRIKNKHGIIVEIYKSNLSEKDSHKLEIELINKIGIENLCNHTLGGEGMSGWKPNDEIRKKMSEQRKGFRHSNESKQKMSIARKGKSKSKEHVMNQAKSLKGRKFTNEHKQKLSQSIRNRKFNKEWGIKSGKARMKKVFCINNGETYESTKEAANKLNLDSGSISRVCNQIYKSTKGYIFRYINNDKNS